MSSRKGKVVGDRESNREKKRGKKKQRGESFICSEKGGKTESNREEKRGKNREKIERREFYMF